MKDPSADTAVSEPVSNSGPADVEEGVPGSLSIGVQVFPQQSQKNAGVQVFPQQSQKNAKIQARVKTKNKAIQSVCKKQTKYCDAGVQCEILEQRSSTPDICDAGVQCEILPWKEQRSSTPDIEAIINTTEEGEASIDDTSMYDEFQCSPQPVVSKKTPDQERKFIVFESCLLFLFSTCPTCNSKTQPKTSTSGTLLSVTQTCNDCKYFRKWESQPYIKNVPAGNLLLSASILFAGAQPTKMLRVLDVFGCATIKARTFYDHQKLYLHQTILNVWSRHQMSMIGVLQAFDEPLSLGGDGRSDSPGHSAKYGAYSLMDLQHNVVLNIEVVQSNEVGSSYHMEKEGLVRGIKFMQDNNLEIGVLVTDRHKQIDKWLRTEEPEIAHRYDVWHVAKSFKKKVMMVAKLKGCEILGEWLRSMVNHLYWCALSTKDGDKEVILEKWLSLVNHLHNKHQGHGNKYKKCSHGRLRGRKWLKYHTKPSEKICEIIRNKTLCQDIQNLSTSYQTSRLESFHSVMIGFAPKSNAFSYLGMKSRLLLAAIHYNNNNNKDQAVTKSGEERYSILFPKYKKGGYIVRKIMKNSSYEYVKELMSELLDVIATDETNNQPTVPDFLCTEFERPNKKTAIKERQTRFAKMTV